MSIDLYYLSLSSPCRAVMLTAEAIGLSLNYKPIDLMAGEQLTPEYEQLNPQKTIPLMIDDDYSLAESRAIMCYLADQYGDNTELYPKSIKARATVHQRLHFDASTLYPSVANYYYPVVFRGQTEYDDSKFEKLKDAFSVFDKLLDGTDEYATGPNLTIADLALIATVSTAETFGLDLNEYKNVSEWAERVKSSAPGYSGGNADGLEILKKIMLGTSSE